MRASIIANVPGARELSALPNGDLLVGTAGSTIEIIPAAEAPGVAQAPGVFVTLADDRAESVFFGPDGNLYAGTEHSIWRLGYRWGATSATSVARIGYVRTGAVSPGTDGDIHRSTSVAVAGSTLYAGVGSSCDACVEVDPTRASVQAMGLDGSGMTAKAKNLRNPIALAVDPRTNFVWAGGAGQDHLPYGHPFETLDPVSAHPGVADYGWPFCYENRSPAPGASVAQCAGTTVAALVFPAYSTLIGAAFYPAASSGVYAFPASYRGGLFVSMHGSWHNAPSGLSAAVPQVAFVPFTAGAPSIPVNWNDPTAQWQPFFFNFGTTASNRIGRPTGIAVGPQGSLFVADDSRGNIYRIRPAVGLPAAGRRSLGR